MLRRQFQKLNNGFEFRVSFGKRLMDASVFFTLAEREDQPILLGEGAVKDELDDLVDLLSRKLGYTHNEFTTAPGETYCDCQLRLSGDLAHEIEVGWSETDGVYIVHADGSRNELARIANALNPAVKPLTEEIDTSGAIL